MLLAGCVDVLALRPEFRAAASRHDALEMSDRLEELIDRQQDTTADRQAAYDEVRGWPQRTAEYAYARAALAGRLAQAKGLTGTHLVAEAERWGIYSMKLDPKFRRGAARRMLGTMYALAPASLVKHGDSERGLELLMEQLAAYPDDIENHLRVAEAYLALDDPDPAGEHLCHCLAVEKKLRPSDRRTLASLLEQAGGRAAVSCEEATAPAP